MNFIVNFVNRCSEINLTGFKRFRNVGILRLPDALNLVAAKDTDFT